MIQQRKISKFKKTVAIYLAMMILLETLQPMQIYALTGGPSQPEFEAFTPIGTSDMVDLASGDFNYNIPIMDVGGYPINLAYNSGVTMDQEASWVGLGWNLDVGQINRQLRGIPDDFNGDEMIYENNLKPNITIGSAANVFATAFGVKESKVKVSAGLGVKYNNYDGVSVSSTFGLSYQISDNLSVGMDVSSSMSEGVSVSPRASFSPRLGSTTNNDIYPGLNAGVSYNSRKGVESMTIGMSLSTKFNNQENIKKHKSENESSAGSMSGTLSFIDASFTPTKRVGMTSSNFMFNLNIEGEFWGIEPGMKFSGYISSQGIKDSEKYKTEKAYGFENTYNAGKSDVLDFNREKDRTFNKNTTSLPVTNNTYDIYSIQGQGISGMYRPYKSQVGYVYDNETTDASSGGNLGLEFGAGGGVHFGIDKTITLGKSKSAVWNQLNPALERFKEKKSGNSPDYEKVFFKNIGGSHVDQELNILKENLGGYSPIRLNIEGGKFSRKTSKNYYTDITATPKVEGTGSIIRKKRLSRNQSIQKLTRSEALSYGSSKYKNKEGFDNISPFSIKGKHDHHTSEIKITKDGGERYIYGRAAYNTVKKETTFDVGLAKDADFKNGLVSYKKNADNSINNDQDGDKYFNRITTPAYAHSYLLTSVLSSEYQDLTDDGPSDDDLGTYTKFEYENKNKAKSTYKWRVPFKKDMANYDEGLRASKKDNKGNYIYGEKELLYIKKIVTKTHVAIFHLSERKDGYGVADENGGLGEDSKMYKLDKISLYSKPEYEAKEEPTPIKEAHFEYNYSLCPGIDNNINNTGANKDNDDLDGERGKLTLSKVYFTYKNSKMGKFTPYVFNYASKVTVNHENNVKEYDLNVPYDMKAYDVWGNYKKSNDIIDGKTLGNLSNAEYPFVDQSDREAADLYAATWLLKTIQLPSGGKIEVNFETDDYAFVQNKEAMQMFKVVGSGNNPSGTIYNDINKISLGKYIYIEIDKNFDIHQTNAVKKFEDTYLKSLGGEDNPLYFRFLLNMTTTKPLPGASEDKYDYVTGYVRKDISGCRLFEIGVNKYASIPVQDTGSGDNFESSTPVSPIQKVNPIQKAGWNFGRQYLSRLMYDKHREEDTKNVKGIVMQLIGSIQELSNIFKSPDQQLKDNGIASKFVTNKSWIRLMNTNGHKIGGGSRVKNIQLHDQWDVMTENTSDDNYKQFYGQKYTYTDKDGNSSGVATYEPLGCKENPFVKPFYDKNKKELLLGPDVQNYVEEPFGESFFPSPKITYSRVTVANLPREKKQNSVDMVVKKHATGSVVTEFYTSKEFPTLTDRTTLAHNFDTSTALANILNLSVKNHITLSQGFSVHTNDMDGKIKNQQVYGEDQKEPISGVEYNYSKTTTVQNSNSGRLNNTISTIDSEGAIRDKLVGVDYDVINDFRESTTTTTTGGVQFNLATLPFTLVVIVVPMVNYTYSKHEDQIRIATTTKVIHSSGILVEKIAFDNGSKVSTKNLAWDADTGEVLLTETTNEYNDHYYSFNFPAYWSYAGMSQAAKNAELTSKIVASDNGYRFEGNSTDKLSDYLINGDEVWVTGKDVEGFKQYIRAWIVKLTDTNFKLLDINGKLVKNIASDGKMKVIRSGYRNMQMASMASITSMRNPLYKYNANNDITGPRDVIAAAESKNNPAYLPNANDRIVNASAVEYNDIWPSQCECNLPKMTFAEDGSLIYEYEKIISEDDDADSDKYYNPYLYNVLGNWRANKSFAYLTGRNYTADPTPRKTGFFIDFASFYLFEDNKWSIKNTDKWTYASEVTQYNPYGQEVENRDALNRYSSAIYGYNNRFPVAVGSNTKYNELANDGFEDYDSNPECVKASHFDYKAQLKQNDISVSSSQSHTGRKSLRIAPGKKATVKKQVILCAPTGTTVQ
ncbi:hypothetical protein [Flavobacterium hydrophilum]|uniref:PA14 domain-containing protein n=1 Tax=Flavobacterium hydrophilum TaxID=2211445 RepID=A0A2V4BVX4_9FLAO|nr:hypothetical protein [Flavobacterium hydrophilum]PXY43159.1 hypothetical protein DMB68_20940 [Flavobacterium hydrophilum]